MKNKRKIGRYQIRSILGKGSMGSVYKVILPEINKLAALKLFWPTKAAINKMGYKWLYEQFVQEASIIASMRHENIVSIFSFEKEDEKPFYLMEYFCRNLGNLIGETYWADGHSRIVSIEKAVYYTKGILEGLARLHHDGIVHRDIKPFNIMLTDCDKIKITDFGLSKRRGEIVSDPEKMMIGTPYYAAPEQTNQSLDIDPRADLYSTGILLYRMLTGILPKDKFQTPGSKNHDLDTTWDRFIIKSIDKDPDKRFQNAKSMIKELDTTFQIFMDHRKDGCNLPYEDKVLQAASPSKKNIVLRSKPQRILAKTARSVFDINDSCHPNDYLNNVFEAFNEKIIMDKTCSLIWQREGSEYPVRFSDAQIYIDQLNKNKFEGYQTWRMPTINELLSLLAPQLNQNSFCFNSSFSPTQKWLWSADTRSGRSAWTVDAEMGFVTSSDILDYYFVRGVSTK